MAPPIFENLGKATRDLFSKKVYILDVLNVTAKGVTCGDLLVNTDFTQKFEDGKVKASYSATYPFPDLGLKLTHMWNTQNTIGASAEATSNCYPGLAVKLEGQLSPDSGDKNGKLAVSYKRDFMNLNTSYFGGTRENENQLVDAGLVLGTQGWLAGGRVEYDVTGNAVKNHYVGLGHSYGNLQAFLFSQNDEKFTADLYQRVNNRLEMGLEFGYDNGEAKKKFYTLGAHYLIDEGIDFRAKVDNDSVVGLGLESTLKGCVKVLLSCALNGKNLGGGNHNFGIGIQVL